MTITVTPDATNKPPRVRVDVAVPAGAVMSAVAIYRTDADGRALIRSQPSAGFDARSVYDYECPYGVPVVYDWAATYNDPTQIPLVWTEAWANLTAWTVVGGSWAVASGKLVWTGADDPTASVTRTLTAGRYRFSFASVPVGVKTIDFGGFSIDVANSRLISGAQSVTFTAGTGTWVIDMTPTSVVLTTSAGTFNLAAVAQANKVSFVGAVATIGAVTNYNLTTGTGSGQLQNARHMVIDPTSGNLLISDPSTNRILVFTPAGVYVTTFGTAGTGNGQFSQIRSMAIDASRNVFVGDGFRIQKFAWNAGTSNYVYSAQVGTSGTGNGQFGYVSGLAVDSAGLVYATDYNNNRVQRFTNALVYSTQWGTAGSANGQFTNPSDITVAASGAIYVQDNPVAGGLNRIQKFSAALAYDSTLPIGQDDGQIYFEYSMTTQGNVLYIISSPAAAVRYAQMKLQKFSPSNTYLGKIDNVGPGGTNVSQNTLAVGVNAAGDIFVLDGGIGSAGADGLSTPTGQRIRKWPQAKASVGALTVNSYGSTITLSETAAPITLTPSPLAAWLIHPARPAVSVPVTYDDLDRTTFANIGKVTREATASRHRILGERKTVTVVTGPRAASAFDLSLDVELAQDVAAVFALLDDQTPILIRVPPIFGMDIEEGFYAVGDVDAERYLQEYDQPSRVMVLPLEATQTPTTAVQNAGWTWAQVAAEFATTDALKAAFATNADLQINNRRPGF